jgi:uncharacterized protein YgiM (DUF1202 family)
MRGVIWRTALAILLIATLARAQAAGDIVYVNVPTVNIRVDAGTQYAVHKVVKVGDALKILEEQGSWYKVELEDKSAGWVHKNTVTEDMPDVAKIAQLESKLETQTTELVQYKSQLKQYTDTNSKLNKQVQEAMLEVDKLSQQNKKFKSLERIKSAGIIIVVLLLGWGLGFFTGFFKRQAEDKRFIKMMVEADSLKKP